MMGVSGMSKEEKGIMDNLGGIGQVNKENLTGSADERLGISG